MQNRKPSMRRVWIFSGTAQWLHFMLLHVSYLSWYLRKFGLTTRSQVNQCDLFLPFRSPLDVVVTIIDCEA